MAIQFRPFRRVSSAARRRAQDYLRDPGNPAAVESVVDAEVFVRENPETVVWTAFIFGLLVGAAAGWAAAERRERHWYDRFDDYAGELRRRFHW